MNSESFFITVNLTIATEQPYIQTVIQISVNPKLKSCLKRICTGHSNISKINYKRFEAKNDFMSAAHSASNTPETTSILGAAINPFP